MQPLHDELQKFLPLRAIGLGRAHLVFSRTVADNTPRCDVSHFVPQRPQGVSQLLQTQLQSGFDRAKRSMGFGGNFSVT